MFWAITVLSTVGVVLNIYKNKWGFFCWCITNAAWAVIDFKKGIPEQGVTFLIFFLTSLWGFIFWSKQGNLKKE